MNNSLAEVRPELVPEWSEKNLPLKPDEITFGSNKKVWWSPLLQSPDEGRTDTAPTVWSAGVSDIWQNMFHRMSTMKNLVSGDMKISRSSRKTGKLQSQKIRKISSIS